MAVTILAVLAVLMALPGYSGTNYVSLLGGHIPPFASWYTASTNIQDALNASTKGNVVLVSNGVYRFATSNTVIVVSNAVTLTSLGGAANTTIDGEWKPMTAVVLLATNAVIDGFTITRVAGMYSRYSCSVLNCTVISNRSPYHGGIQLLDHGMISNCVVSYNYAGMEGGGVWCTDSSIINTIISHNFSHREGGGMVIYGGTVENCAIYGNQSFEFGGGISAWGNVTLRHCTVIANTAGGYCGGLYAMGFATRIRAEATIFYYNTPLNYAFFCSNTHLENVCTTPHPASENDTVVAGVFLTNEPGVVSLDNPHLVADSPCIGAAEHQMWPPPAPDIDGEVRVGTQDIGCDQYITLGITGELSVAIAPEYPRAVTNTPITFRATTSGKAGGRSWQPDDGTPAVRAPTITKSYPTAGTYHVTFTAANHSGMQTSSTEVEIVEQRMHYVSPDGGNVPPYTNWANAAHEIGAAIAVASPGGVVTVSNGVYTVAQQIVVDKPLTLISASGAADTVIDGQFASRCLVLSNHAAVVDGFTVCRGSALGGGVYLYPGGTLRNSVVTNNCTPIATSGALGGGVLCTYGSRVEDCLIAGNYAWSSGGGACVVFGTLDRCTFAANSAGFQGGGAYCYPSGAVLNSLFARNAASRGAAVNLFSGNVLNCTMVSNRFGSVCEVAEWTDVATFGKSFFENCIIYHNEECGGAIGGDTGNAVVLNCCTDYEPWFVDLTGGDYHLSTNSPCINAGTNMPWMLTAHDHDGRPRIVNGRVDIGAYEYVSGPAIHLDASSLEFGDIIVDSASTQALTVANLGTAMLTGNVSGVQAPFAVGGLATYVLEVSSNVAVSFVFTPTEMMTCTNTVTFTGGGSVQVTLTGSGVPEPVIPVVFGSLLLAGITGARRSRDGRFPGVSRDAAASDLRESAQSADRRVRHCILNPP